MINLFAPALDLAAAVQNGRFSARSVVEATIERIDAVDVSVNAYTAVLRDRALKDAEEVDRRVARGEELPLAGVPLAVKDMVWMAGVPATAGSKALKDFVPTETSVVVSRLVEAGAVVVGTTNMPEFGYRGDTASSVWGETRNPWNLDLVPGGSSSGSGAALSCGTAALAVGTDAGGSIRMPAAFCGVVGHKPTLGLVPSKPGFAGWLFLSVTGPMARTVSDAAAMLAVLAGPDSRDPDAVPLARWRDRHGETTEDLRGMRIAVSEDFGSARLEPEVREGFRRVVASFSQLGCELVEAHPLTPDPLPVWMTLATAAIRAAHARYLERSHDLDPDSVRWIEAGTGMDASEYVAALHARFAISTAWASFFDEYDLVLYPGQQSLPYPIGSDGPLTTPADAREGDWSAMDFVANITGQPACCVPCGFTAGGLPMAFQLMGRRFDDARVLAAAAVWERRFGESAFPPPLVAE